MVMVTVQVHSDGSVVLRIDVVRVVNEKILN